MSHSEHLRVAIAAANKGADVTRKYFADLASAGIKNKTASHGYDGIVTQADVEAERAIVESIRTAFPDHHFMAEEDHSDSADSEHLWIIDPIDGTNNFAHGIPHYAVSVAYYHHGVAQCGCVLRPETNDEFIAEQGRGAVHNGDRVSVSTHSTLAETMLGVGFYYDRGDMMRATLNAIDALFQENIHGVRRMGTAALDIVQVGLGRFGGFFEYQLSPWDFAAARLFLEEAGGKITTCTGDELPLEKTSVLATNGRLHESMLAIVNQHADY